MSEYRVIAIPSETADAVRATLASPRYGHPAHAEVATGYGPCRHCLQFFDVGRERRLLFTFDPFAESGASPLPGPIFIHETRCERYPEEAGFPAHLLDHPLTLAAYGPDRRLVAELRLRDRHAEPAIAELLARPGVDYLHVRDTNAGCFDCRIQLNSE